MGGRELVRDGGGQFRHDRKTAERDAHACDLRERGLSYKAIAEQMGYAGHWGARQAVERALKAIVQEPAEDLRTLELARLDKLWQVCVKVLESTHYVVSDGRLIYIGPKGEEQPLLDDSPALACVDRMLKIQDRRARLLGLDAPTKIKAEVTAEPMPDAVLTLIQQTKERLAAGARN